MSRLAVGRMPLLCHNTFQRISPHVTAFDRGAAAADVGREATALHMTHLHISFTSWIWFWEQGSDVPLSNKAVAGGFRPLPVRQVGWEKLSKAVDKYGAVRTDAGPFHLIPRTEPYWKCQPSWKCQSSWLAPRGVIDCTRTTFTEGRSIFSRSTENGPALPSSSRVQPRSPEKFQPSCPWPLTRSISFHPATETAHRVSSSSPTPLHPALDLPFLACTDLYG